MGVTRPLRLTNEHVRRFAEASGDRNPLHLDERFARTTPYGRCIVHGALVVVAALRSADPDSLRHVEQLDIQFKQPVFPCEGYIVSSAPAAEGRTRIEVAWAGRPMVVIGVAADRSAPPLPPASSHEPSLSTSTPREHAIAAVSDVAITEAYAPRLELLSELAVEVGAGAVPGGVLVWLAAASYTVGMLVPGRDAVFAGARIRRSPQPRAGTLDASVSTADDRTGLVIVETTVGNGEASARMTLSAFLRPSVSPPTRASIAHYVPSSTELAGRNVLVVGASRGLGAALSATLASQGATVWAAFACCAEHVERLRREFGTDRVRPLQFDASDIEQARRAVDGLRADAGALDGVALCAAPPLYEAPLHPDALPSMLQYLGSSMAMALVPLAEALQLLSPDGWVVITSSSALDDPPDAWPHYVVAKSAIEGAAAYCARHTEARVAVARPPRMWTDSMNSPLARIGAAPPERVAAGIVRWAMGEEATSGVVLLTPEQL
jgi:NAD(P)-dependent dehydrogenase (short-subunit alcohol dehydrogenase family)